MITFGVEDFNGTLMLPFDAGEYQGDADLASQALVELPQPTMGNLEELAKVGAVICL
jgi:hypothetical protein